MRINKIVPLLSVVLLNPAFASDTEISLQEANTLIRQASNNNISVESVFEGPNDLTGVVMRSPTGKGIAWIPDDGKNIIVGMLMDERGKNLSLEAHEKYIGAFEKNTSDSTNHDGVIESIDGLPSVPLGDNDGKKILYVFGDLNCHYCEDLYRRLDSADLDDVAVKWIPVAVLGEKSLDQAATLLNAEPGERAELLKNHHGPTHETIEQMSHDHERYLALKGIVKKSSAILAQLGDGTPLLVYWNGASIDMIPRSPSKQELQSALIKIKPR